MLIDITTFKNLQTNLTPEQTKITMLGATGNPMRVIGRSHLEIAFGNFKKIHPVIVIEGLKQGFLLGRDFISRHDAILNYKDGHITFGDGNINIPFIPMKMIRARLAQNTTFRAHSTCVIKIEVEPIATKNYDGVWFEGGLIKKDKNLFLPRTIVKPTQNNLAFVQVTNTGDHDISLSKEEIVGDGELFKEFGKDSTSFRCNLATKANQIIVNQKDLGLENLTSQQKQSIVDIVNQSNILKTELGEVTQFQHEIDTGNFPPINTPQYRVPYAKRQVMAEEAKKMLIKNVVTHSNSPYNSPVVLAMKPQGGVRFAIDFRKLNKQTIKIPYPIPRIEESLNSLGGAKYFSTLDLECAFWQLPLKEEDKQKTAFSVDGVGHLHFNNMPYGLTNASASFQKLMDRVLVNLHWSHCLVYLDDVIIFGKDLKEHNERLKTVLGRLHEAGLTLKYDKCKWGRNSVKYLGHFVSNGEIKVDPTKTEAVQNFPVPKSVRNVRSFLGLAAYYRRFVPNFADIAKPLTALTKTKNAPRFAWNDKAEIAFKTIKKCLLEPPCLNCPDFSLPFVVQTDASDVGLGAVLAQYSAEGTERVVAYASRQLKTSEVKYAAIQKELLAIVWALKVYHFYLFGQKHFTVLTDHCPLIYLRNKEPKGALIERWILKMQVYNFDIKHRSGSKNANADALSRCPLVDWDEDYGKEMCPSYAVVNALSIDDLAQVQDGDEEIYGIKTFLEHGILPEDPKLRRAIQLNGDRYIIENGVLYHKWKPGFPNNDKGRLRKQIMVPKEQRGAILLGNHEEANHPGYLRTLARIREQYFWPTLLKDVARHTQNCQTCKLIKATKKYKANLQPIVVTKPLEIVDIDFVGPLPMTEQGNKYILTFQDHFSRWPAAYPMEEATSENVVSAIKKFSNDFGYPTTLLSDRGTNLKSKMVDKACKRLNIGRKLTSSFHPETNGKLERWHSTLKNALAVNQKNDWDLFVGDIVAAYRTTPHTATKETPAFLFMGREFEVNPNIEFRAPAQDFGGDFVKERMASLQEAYGIVRGLNKEAQERSKKFYDKTSSKRRWVVGNWVWLRRGDEKDGVLDRVKFSGPYKILEVKNDQTVKLDLPKGCKQHPTVHVNRLKPDDSVKLEDIKGRIKRVLDTKKVRAINGRLTNKKFVELDMGHTLWVPAEWVDGVIEM